MPSLLSIVSSKTQGRCWYCGEPADTADHQVPRAQGGTDDYQNIVPACRGCNSSKGARTAEEYRRKLQAEEGAPVYFWAEFEPVEVAILARDSAAYHAALDALPR